MTDDLPAGFEWEWGAKHAQGIRWETSERAAREWITMSLPNDQRKQRQAQGKYRLVRRARGPIEEVWNPYAEVVRGNE